MDLDTKFRVAGMSELVANKDFYLVAKANRLDNFTLWAAKIIDNGIWGALDPFNTEQAVWFNDFSSVKGYQGIDKFNQRPTGDWHPSNHPFIQQIALEAWKKANNTFLYCTQCGYSDPETMNEIEDFKSGMACPSCGIGPIRYTEGV
jgi:hypothetical protein